MSHRIDKILELRTENSKLENTNLLKFTNSNLLKFLLRTGIGKLIVHSKGFTLRVVFYKILLQFHKLKYFSIFNNR